MDKCDCGDSACGNCCTCLRIEVGRLRANLVHVAKQLAHIKYEIKGYLQGKSFDGLEENTKI